MKKLVLTILLLAGLMQAQNNALLYTADGSLFSVYINDRLYNQQPQASVLIEGIKKDTLYLKIETKEKEKLGVTIYLLDKGQRASGKEFDYQLSLHNGKLKVLFTGVYDAYAPRQTLVPQPPVADTSQKNMNPVFGHFCEIKNRQVLFFNNLPASGPCKTPMPAEYMAYTDQLMQKTYADEDKLRTIESVCHNNCLSLEQLNALMLKIDHDMEKLNILHAGYLHLVDTAGKKSLTKQFHFESFVREANNFFKDPQAYYEKNGSGCTISSPPEAVRSLVDALGTFDNDNQRLALFKRNYTQHCYNIDQVILLLQKFIHEREKLEAAKLLYTHCIERNKFAEVNSQFSYSQSVEELNQFIRAQSGR